MIIFRRLSVAFVMLLLFWVNTALAVGMLRDPDIEHGLKEVSAPVLKAAGLDPKDIKIILINDDSLNAFVIDQQHIFLNAGLVKRMQTAGQLQAVIAHEAAHIANGHIQRRIAKYDEATRMSSYGVLLAAAISIMVDPKAGIGLATGVTGSADQIFRSHTRSEEATADKSALLYLTDARISAREMRDVFQIFQAQEPLSSDKQSVYVRSHPLTKERLRTVEVFMRNQQNFEPNAQAEYWFKRLKGKLVAFQEPPKRVLAQAKSGSEIDLMQQAIALHRSSQSQAALEKINQVLKMQPNDPYYYELKGQILLENRQFSSAVETYKRAVQLAPRNAQIIGGYGRALLALKTSSSDELALKNLIMAHSIDQRDARVLQQLAAAYARTGNSAMASITTAERFALLGDLGSAKVHAERAIDALPEGSSAWRRAKDILGPDSEEADSN